MATVVLDDRPVVGIHQGLEELDEGEMVIADDSSLGGGGPRELNFNWLNHFKNVLDPFHVPILHARFSGLQFNEDMAVIPEVQFAYTDEGVGAYSMRTTPDGRTLYRMTEAVLPNLRLVASPTMTSAGPSRLLGWVVPRDGTPGADAGAGARPVKPLAVLDVDGVVVLEDPTVPVVAHTVRAYGRWRREILLPAVAPALLQRLSELFDCAWASAWAHTAHTAHPALRGPLDLPAEPWAWVGVQFHKLAAIRALADGRPWVWIDDGIDDLGPVSPPPDGLLVRVDPRRGIADVDPDALFARVSALGVSARP